MLDRPTDEQLRAIGRRLRQKNLRPGRPPGTLATKTRRIAEAAAESGETPLEYMLRVMRDETAEPARRDEMAKSAAHYMHPRINAIELTGAGGDAIQHIHRIERVIVDHITIEAISIDTDNQDRPSIPAPA